MRGKIMLSAVCIVALLAGAAQAATTVKMTGDAQIWGNYFNQLNYTGWNANGKKSADPFVIWQRFRLRTDFIANENLKFRLSTRVYNKAWGNNTFTVDNPAVAIDVEQCFLQFKWPGTQAEFSIGMQDWSLPISSPMLSGSPVFGKSRSAAALFSIPATDQVQVVGGFTRMVAATTLFEDTTTQLAGDLDGYYLSVPVTLDGFKAVPWGLVSVVGRDTNFTTPMGTGPKITAQRLSTSMLSANAAANPSALRNAQNLYWWAGLSASLTALDPFKFYADFIYGSGAGDDRQANARRGYFFDVAAEYTGFDLLTPQMTFWYSSGEDSSLSDGSERMPTIRQGWSPSGSFLLDGGHTFGAGYMGLDPVGSWGLAASLNKISFIKDLSHRLTVSYSRGVNSASSLRKANALLGVGNYVQMGSDLAENEYVVAVNLDHQYTIYENLAAIVEMGWAHGEFQKSIWGRRFVNKAGDCDPIKVAFGFKYKF